MGDGEDETDIEDLPPRFVGDGEETLPSSFDGLTIPEAVERLERKMILDGLRETGWNKTRAAEKLGISRRNLIWKVSDYELEQYQDDDS